MNQKSPLNHNVSPDKLLSHFGVLRQKKKKNYNKNQTVEMDFHTN